MKIIRANRPVKEPTPKLIRFGWPLAINQGMDFHAAFHGMGHWSCVSPKSNELWLRRDGGHKEVSFFGPGGYLDDLKDYDRKNPVRDPLKMFRGKTNR